MVHDPYRRIARVYDPIFAGAALGLARATVSLVEPPDNARILDVGCGTGVLLGHCVKRGYRAHGVDPSNAMLDRARRRLGTDAELRQADGRKLPYADGAFDAVFATMVLHELAPDTRRHTLREMIRVTRHRGKIAVADYHDGKLRGLGGVVNRVVTTAAEILAGRAHYAGYRHFKRNGCLPGLVADAPLSITTRKLFAGGNLAVHVLQRS